MYNYRMNDFLLDVRLVEGRNPLEGRVELKLNGVWGGIGDDSWDVEDANVICRMIGYM